MKNTALLCLSLAWFICGVLGCKRSAEPQTIARVTPEPITKTTPESIATDPFATDVQPQEDIKPKDWWIFPVGTIEPFFQEWYSEHLVAAKEGKIYSDIGTVQYRFTWLRTFHNPLIFHIKRNTANSYQLTTTKLTGKGGYEPGTVEFSRLKDLSDQQIEELRKLLQEANFWELPTEALDEGGLDGAQWILEIVDGKRYHVVDRWSAGILEEIGMWYLRISEVNIPKEEVY